MISGSWGAWAARGTTGFDAGLGPLGPAAFTAATVTVYTTPAQTWPTTSELSEAGAETTTATGVGHADDELPNAGVALTL